jgi:hypothetical protein
MIYLQCDVNHLCKQHFKRSFLAILVISMIILSLAGPVSAGNGYMSHLAKYDAEGMIDLKKQAGHRCNSGAAMKQIIAGDGILVKDSDIYIISGLLKVSDENEIVTDEFATINLTATSTIELCAPPKRILLEPLSLSHYDSSNLETLGLTELYYSYLKDEALPPQLSYFLPQYLLHNLPDINFNVDSLTEAVSRQVWAASVSADPGFTASLEQTFTAAYGPYNGLLPLEEETADNRFRFGAINGLQNSDPNYPWGYDADSWWLSYLDRGLMPVLGNQYVGNYFTIEQFLTNNQGVSKRYIDISSPWNHGFLFEDMTVTGKAEVRETYDMLNLPSGHDRPVDWWVIERDASRNKNHRLYYEQYLPSNAQPNMIR